MKKMVDLLRNKYFLATLVFAVWMLFFDRNDIASQYEYGRQVSKLQEEKDFYEKEIKQVKKDLNELNTDLQTAEKYARERYFMKKDNEDVFVIIRENKED
ncbi:septum formation initiator family protein [Pedobacter sp. SYP-B3415]|uniref:FtsB family cell division protein n=1 Tax=Pedobacter sp. SYP-B3415 TaxID=2496641 RepID=UPI00101DD606|nr:septum formation initiator family protein [Pedobacter sp. SYP-B3415]